MGKWIYKTWYIHTITQPLKGSFVKHATTWMNLGSIMLTEISQTRKDKYVRFHYMRYLKLPNS